MTIMKEIWNDRKFRNAITVRDEIFELAQMRKGGHG